MPVPNESIVFWRCGSGDEVIYAIDFVDNHFLRLKSKHSLKSDQYCDSRNHWALQLDGPAICSAAKS